MSSLKAMTNCIRAACVAPAFLSMWCALSQRSWGHISEVFLNTAVIWIVTFFFPEEVNLSATLSAVFFKTLVIKSRKHSDPASSALSCGCHTFSVWPISSQHRSWGSELNSLTAAGFCVSPAEQPGYTWNSSPRFFSFQRLKLPKCVKGEQYMKIMVRHLLSALHNQVFCRMTSTQECDFISVVVVFCTVGARQYNGFHNYHHSAVIGICLDLPWRSQTHSYCLGSSRISVPPSTLPGTPTAASSLQKDLANRTTQLRQKY